MQARNLTPNRVLICLDDAEHLPAPKAERCEKHWTVGLAVEKPELIEEYKHPLIAMILRGNLAKRIYGTGVLGFY